MSRLAPDAPAVFAIETETAAGDWLEITRESNPSCAAMLVRRYYAPRWPDRALRVIDVRGGQVRLLHRPGYQTLAVAETGRTR